MILFKKELEKRKKKVELGGIEKINELFFWVIFV